jgi:hypothetical protein
MVRFSFHALRLWVVFGLVKGLRLESCVLVGVFPVTKGVVRVERPGLAV